MLAGIIYLAVEIDQGLEERINERQAELAKLREAGERIPVGEEDT